MFNFNQPAYQTLRSIYAERTNRVIAFVGAGLSAAAGLPNWSQLRVKLAAIAAAKVATLDDDGKDKHRGSLHALSKIDDNWMAFELIEEILGPTSYAECVRKELTPPGGTPVPDGYRRLWELRIDGIITLNLDKFASRGFSECRTGVSPTDITGQQLGSHLHVLRAPSPLIINLHGTINERSSWVMKRAEIRALQKRPGYREFLNTIFMTRTVLFLGITADDVASGGLLADLRKGGNDPGAHFWVTHRRDNETDRWAESNGIETIRYESKNSDHSPLIEALADLAKYVPRDDTPPPVVVAPAVASTTRLPSPDELDREDSEVIRAALNRRASEILSSRSESSFQDYKQFCREYESPIHRAYFVSTAPPKNSFFGYAVSDTIGKGMFGRVFKALAPDGSPVAIKLLRDEVREDDNMLSGFRRGVRAMQILEKHKVQGMVSLKEAHELPASVVMEFVEGPTLDKAMEARALEDVRDRLRIARDLVRIIRTGHQLPERVLHRDVRPQNIMLRSFYTDPSGWEVVVLDFDLSWHREAAEKSLDVNGAAALGYAAPEQLSSIPGVSTRNALVDSYGIGMTLYFLFSGLHPMPGERTRPDWANVAADRLSGLVSPRWRSLPSRLSTLIVRSTQIEQSRRLDCSQIDDELERLVNADRDPTKVESAELWAHELLARSSAGYEWNYDQLQGGQTFANGTSFVVSGNESAGTIRLRLGWASSGTEDRRNINRYLPKICDQVVSRLKSHRWTILTVAKSEGAFNIEAQSNISNAQSSGDQLALGLHGLGSLVDL